MAKWEDVLNDLTALSDCEKDVSQQFGIMIGELVNQRRKLGLTQQQLADLAGLKQTAIARLERGAVIPRVDTVIKIARVLRMKLKLIADEESVTLA